MKTTQTFVITADSGALHGVGIQHHLDSFVYCASGNQLMKYEKVGKAIIKDGVDSQVVHA